MITDKQGANFQKETDNSIMITDKFVQKETDNSKMITDKQGANFQKETDNSKIMTDKKGAIKDDDILCTTLLNTDIV